MPTQFDNPEVILSANITYYYHTALALQQAGYLRRYICTISLNTKSRWLDHLLFSDWRKKLKGRDISKLDPGRVKMIWWAELLQKVLTRLSLVSVERANWINDHIYDRLARRWVEPCDIFHFVSPIGLYSAQKAKAQGSIIICDVRTGYPDFEWQIVQEEYKRLCIGHDSPKLLLAEKIKAEYALTDYWFVYSSYAKRTFVQAGMEADRVFVVPLGIDLTRFDIVENTHLLENSSYISPKSDVFRIIYTGQIIPRKGVHYLIEAFEALALPKAELLLVGKVADTMRPLIEAAIQRNPQIRAIGSVPQMELFRYYQTSSVFVLPSSLDSWGLVVLEAMACGLPVIVTENTGSQEVVREGVDGFIIPIRSPEALQEKLLYLYERPETRQTMGQTAYHHAREFTWDRYKKRLLEVYTEILRRGLPTGRYMA